MRKFWTLFLVSLMAVLIAAPTLIYAEESKDLPVDLGLNVQVDEPGTVTPPVKRGPPEVTPGTPVKRGPVDVNKPGKSRKPKGTDGITPRKEGIDTGIEKPKPPEPRGLPTISGIEEKITDENTDPNREEKKDGARDRVEKPKPPETTRPLPTISGTEEKPIVKNTDRNREKNKDTNRVERPKPPETPRPLPTVSGIDRPPETPRPIPLPTISGTDRPADPNPLPTISGTEKPPEPSPLPPIEPGTGDSPTTNTGDRK